jgi:trimeric autotransporter adhesin
LGVDALTTNTTGGLNTAIGYLALNANTTANNNTAVGYQSLYANTTGSENNAFGVGALQNNTTGNDNLALGRLSLRDNTTGTGNTAVGEGGGSLMTTGSANTILGRYNGNQGGLDIRTASNHIVLSDGDGNPRGIFDGSGNWLVGKTAFDTNTAGFEARSTGFIGVTRADVGAYFTRLTTDGEIMSILTKHDAPRWGVLVTGGYRSR